VLKEVCSFLKKRTKRLLFLRLLEDPGHDLERGSCGETKVFCFFSSEKKILSAARALTLPTAARWAPSLSRKRAREFWHR
jgi:hypothetical protein